MPAQNLRKELLDASKVVPAEGEADTELAKRIVAAMDRMPDDVWEAMPAECQHWYNKAGAAFDANKPEEVPPMGGADSKEDDLKKTKTKAKAAPAATKAAAPAPAAKPKAAAKAAAPKAAKAAKATNGASKTPGRPGKLPDTAKIKLLKKENPHRKGTHLYNVWDKYTDGMTVAEALAAIKGVSGNTSPRANLAWQVSLGYISVK